MKELTTQLQHLLEGKKTVLIVTHQHVDGDGLSAMLVLKKLFEKQGLEVTALCPDEIPEVFHFLPGIHEVSASLRNSHDFIISLKAKNAEVDKLKYSVDGDILNIVVTPKKGTFFPEDVSARQAIGEYDLIVVVDSGDLEHLGSFYEENTEMFYNTPVVNIDHHVTNTAFGVLNFVDITAASTTQIVYNIIQDFEGVEEFLSADIATLLLTGLVVDTGSFQHTNTSPKSLELAADLIEAGARQQEIIQNIYKTKQLSTLKLWGRVLAKIEEDPIHKIVWSTITREDLAETGAGVDEAEGLIDELMTNAPGSEIIVLLKDSLEGVMSASLRSTGIAIDTLPIANHFGGGGHRQASGFKQKGHNFSRFIADVIGYIEQYQEERLNLTSEDIEAMREELESKRQKLAQVTRSDNEAEGENFDILSEITTSVPKREKEERGVEIRTEKAQESVKSQSQQQKGVKQENNQQRGQQQRQENRQPQNQSQQKQGQNQQVKNDRKETKNPQQPQQKGVKQENNQQRGQQQRQENRQPQNQSQQKQQDQPKVQNQQQEQKKPDQAPENSRGDQNQVQTATVSPSESVEVGNHMTEIPVVVSNEEVAISPESTVQEFLVQPQQESISEIPQTQDLSQTPEPIYPVDQAIAAQSSVYSDQPAPVEVQQVEGQYFQNPQQEPLSQQQSVGQQGLPEQVSQQQFEQGTPAQSYQQNNYEQAVQQQTTQQPQINKEQAQQYAYYYAQQLQQMNPQSQEYAQVYQYYMYYAQMAQ